MRELPISLLYHIHIIALAEWIIVDAVVLTAAWASKTLAVYRCR